MHQPAGDVHFAHRPPGPGDDLRGEHRPNTDFLADGHEQGVHPRRVGRGQFGDVADPHEQRGVGVTPARLGEALERRHEAVPDRLDDGVDQVGHAPALERADGRLERLDPLAEVGDRHDAGPRAGEVSRHGEVRAVDAQHELGARPHGRSDLGGLEGVDAHPHPRGEQLAHDFGEGGERAPRGASDVDHVRAARVVILGLAAQRVAREPGRVVHLGHDLDVVRPVRPHGRRAPEVLGDLAQVLGALLDPHTDLLCDHRGIALAQSRDQNEIGAGGHIQEPRDPGSGHQGGHGDLHDRHVAAEGRRHLGERAAERRLGELSRDEQDPPGLALRRRLHRHRGSPERTNLLGVPSSAPPFGRHSTSSSIFRASSKSLSVTPPAAWFLSFTMTRPHVTARSG